MNYLAIFLSLALLDRCLPPLALADNLPSHAVCDRLWRMADGEYRALLHASNECWERRHEGPELETASWNYSARAQQQEERAAIWSAVWYVNAPNRTWIERRQALQKLIDVAGRRAVVTGELPSPLLFP